MGIITAPVVGSGAWPAWIARVPNLFELMSSSRPATQIVEQVVAGDQPEKLVAVHDDRDVALVEYRQQRTDRRARLQRLEPRRHRRAHRLAKAVCIAVDRHEDVRFID